jgi:hypothetical protein
MRFGRSKVAVAAVETADVVAVITAQDRGRFYRVFQKFA